MNILTNICNPKEEHFEQQARTQAYRPLNDYAFENRLMDRMRARHQPVQNPEQYKYQSWNHPYSISNFFLTQKGLPNGQNKQSMGSHLEYVPYQSEPIPQNLDDRNGNKKISFKEIPQTLCGIGKEEEQGEKMFKSRQDFYTSLRSNQQNYGRNAFGYQPRNYGPEDNQTFHRQNAAFSRNQHMDSEHVSSQNTHAYVVLSQEILKLKQENKELKRIIEEEYKPMKVLYSKLLSEQEEREYLISKLQWKVKELVKEMGAASGSFGTGTPVHAERNQYEAKKEVKNISRVDSDKHFLQPSIQLPSNQQPFKAFETNFSNIKLPESKPNAYNNFQSPYKSPNLNNSNEEKPYAHFQYASPSVQNANSYQRPTLQPTVQPSTNLAPIHQQRPVQYFQVNPSFSQSSYQPQAHYQTTNPRFNQ